MFKGDANIHLSRYSWYERKVHYITIEKLIYILPSQETKSDLFFINLFYVDKT